MAAHVQTVLSPPAGLSPAPRCSPRRARFGRAALAAGLSLAAAAPLASPRGAAAQPDGAPARAAAPAGPAAADQREGVLNADALVFSGPGTHSYPTMRLEKGTRIIASGPVIKDEWLRIVPPEGSFSYISQAVVNRYDTGNKGKVKAPADVKAGSALQPLKYAKQTRLDVNDDVTILGEEDEYYKIEPPKGAYLYITRKLVNPIIYGGAPAGRQTPPDAGHAGGGAPVKPDATAGAGRTGEAPSDGAAGPGPAAQPGPTPPVAEVPSTQPGVAALLTQLQKLEGEFTEASKQPLLEQPVPELLEQYQKLAETPGLPEVAKRVADVRITTLKVRGEAREQFKVVEKQQKEFEEKMKVGGAEKQEIIDRIKDDIQLYTAVGTLRTSSLQVSKTPLYRLTDPETGRTVVYVWGTDPKIPELIGQFVGVKGPTQTDPRLNLKVVSPTATEPVDAAKVNGAVAAQITPPSLANKFPTTAPTATTGNQ